MKKYQIYKSRLTQQLFTLSGITLIAAVIVIATVPPVNSQAFTELNKALVDYSKADIVHDTNCDSLNQYKNNDIVQIEAVQLAAYGQTPEQCRVSGLLNPEIAFEISLPSTPAHRPARRGIAERLRCRPDQYRSLCKQGTGCEFCHE